MSIIICGIPKNEAGNYYCPDCGFTSGDIEDFAISMCWDCVYEEDEMYDYVTESRPDTAAGYVALLNKMAAAGYSLSHVFEEDWEKFLVFQRIGFAQEVQKKTFDSFIDKWEELIRKFAREEAERILGGQK